MIGDLRKESCYGWATKLYRALKGIPMDAPAKLELLLFSFRRLNLQQPHFHLATIPELVVHRLCY